MNHIYSHRLAAHVLISPPILSIAHQGLSHAINCELSNDTHKDRTKRNGICRLANIEAKHVKQGTHVHPSRVQSLKARAEPRNKICIPALGDDGAPELSAFAKLYPRLAEEACRRIISGAKIDSDFKVLIQINLCV